MTSPIFIHSNGRTTSAYQDCSDGLIWLGVYGDSAEALTEWPAGIVVPFLPDAPIIDPADESTHWPWGEPE